MGLAGRRRRGGQAVLEQRAGATYQSGIICLTGTFAPGAAASRRAPGAGCPSSIPPGARAMKCKRVCDHKRRRAVVRIRQGVCVWWKCMKREV